MTKLSKDKVREIIDDFVSEIQSRKKTGHKPPTTVIFFRDDAIVRRERPIELVPIELLRYRKDNGRISSDIASYEHYYGRLDETSAEHQEIIRKYLWGKDPEKTDILYHQILHSGQREPAIVTCDGFLINGNRRKMVMEKLFDKYPGDERFSNMKVVILPSKDDEGGPPTLKEIEQIENRYQYHSEGKAEYYGFDRALSMRRKIELGMSLEEQLRDDPQYADLDEKEFGKEVKEVAAAYLLPLECVERYLSHFGREGIYETVSIGYADREGRWQAFIDYSKFYQQIKDGKKRIKLGINEDEIGDIEDVVFKIIRKRDLPGLTKVHDIMRDLSKLISNKDSKKELLKLKTISTNLPKEEHIDKDGKEPDEREIDKIWGEKYAEPIIRQVKKAADLLEFKNIKETPINLLEDALKKLNHKDMDPEQMNPSDIQKAMNLANDIQKRARELASEFYHFEKDWNKNLEKLKKKHHRK